MTWQMTLLTLALKTLPKRSLLRLIKTAGILKFEVPTVENIKTPLWGDVTSRDLLSYLRLVYDLFIVYFTTVSVGQTIYIYIYIVNYRTISEY
jgi:hypothetical protein